MPLVLLHNKPLSRRENIKGMPYSHGAKVMSILCDSTQDTQPGKMTPRTAPTKNNKTSLLQSPLLSPQDPASPAGVS